MGSNVEKYVRQQPIIVNDQPYGPEPRRVALVVSKQSGRFPIYEDEYKKWDNTIQELSKKYDVPAELIHSMMVIVTGKQIGRASCRERVSSPV